MSELFLVLTPIALVDSTSIIPLCIVFLVMLLSGPEPLRRSLALLTGIFVTYTACGLLILFGLQQVFDALNVYAIRVWQSPRTEELLFQIAIGVVLLVLGLRIARAREREGRSPAESAMTLRAAFGAGAVMTLVGMPGAVPYLAAIDLILRSEIAAGQACAALLFYNVIFLAPLLAIVALDAILGDRSKPLLEAIKGFFDRWGRRLIIGLLLVLGLVLLMDGIGWFLGRPLLPVPG